MTRILPTAPGWWWGAYGECQASPTRVEQLGGHLVADDGATERPVDDPQWAWLEPVPCPGEAAAAERAELDRLLGIHPATPEERAEVIAEMRAAVIEVRGLRNQVAELVANGVSIAKAADRARHAERAAIVTYLRDLVDDEPESSAGWELVHLLADRILRGAHEVEP